MIGSNLYAKKQKTIQSSKFFGRLLSRLRRHDCQSPFFYYLCTKIMGRLMSIDFGRRRCGIAATDTLRIVANGVATVDTAKLSDFVKNYIASESVDAVIVGYPRDMHGNPSDSVRYLTPAINRLKKEIAPVQVIFFDERFTSVIAHRAMIDGGMKKMDRRDKAVVDEISATIILNDFLQSRLYSELNL